MHNLLRKTNYINILMLASIGIFLFSGVAWAGNNGLAKSLAGDKSIKFNGGKSSYKSVGDSAPQFNSGTVTFKPSVGRVPKTFNPGAGSFRLNGGSSTFKFNGGGQAYNPSTTPMLSRSGSGSYSLPSGGNNFKFNPGTRVYRPNNAPKPLNTNPGSYRFNGNGNNFNLNTPNALKQLPKGDTAFRPTIGTRTNFKLQTPNSQLRTYNTYKQLPKGGTAFKPTIGARTNFKLQTPTTAELGGPAKGESFKLPTPSSQLRTPNIGAGKFIGDRAPKFNSPRVMSTPKPAQQLPKGGLALRPANFKFNTGRSLNIAQRALGQAGQPKTDYRPVFKLASLPLRAAALPKRGPEAPVSPFQRPQPLSLPAPAPVTGSNAPASNANSQPTNTGGGHTGNHGHSPVATILFGLFGHLPIPFRERMRKMLSGISQRQNNGIGSIFAARAPAINAVAECSLAFDHRLQPEESVTFTPAENRIERKGFFVSGKALIFRSLELNSGLFCFTRQNGR